MTILFLHGWQSIPGGVKPSYLKDHGHAVINPKLPDEDFTEAVRIAQAKFDKHQPQVVVGSSRGGAVAVNINSGNAKLVLLCPAWKKYGTAKTVKPDTVILHSRADDVVPFADSEELALRSGATLIEVGNDHRLADQEPLAAMLRACEGDDVGPSPVNEFATNINLEDFSGELRWSLIEPELERFQSFLIPLARRLKIEADVDVLHSKLQKGVYLLFDERERLLYVGVSLDKFGNRLATHRRRFEWKWADLIVFPEEMAFFALALESFLIQRFRPPLNFAGTKV